MRILIAQALSILAAGIAAEFVLALIVKVANALVVNQHVAISGAISRRQEESWIADTVPLLNVRYEIAKSIRWTLVVALAHIACPC